MVFGLDAPIVLPTDPGHVNLIYELFKEVGESSVKSVYLVAKGSYCIQMKSCF